MSVTLLYQKLVSYTEPNETVAGPGTKRRTLISVRTLQSDRQLCHLGCFPYMYVTDGAVLCALLPRAERFAPKQMRSLQGVHFMRCTKSEIIFPLHFSIFMPYRKPF
jgi:hypothetical protein